LQSRCRRFAFKQIDFKTLGKLLVMLALFFKIQFMPIFQRLYAKPVQQRLGIGQQLLAAVWRQVHGLRTV
jgi:GNAT superfamily N-acetyltransferase